MSSKPKHPSRTWSLVLTLGIPLAIVGASAMAISYATLIDVARVNGPPLPELFPVLVDVGTVATMVAAAQFRHRGVNGRWLAYATFIALSAVSIVANSTHAWRAADMTVTTPWAAALLAATPPAALLAITHLVMLLVPDQKERAKLHTARERTSQEPVAERRTVPVPQPFAVRAVPSRAAPRSERYEPGASLSPVTRASETTASKNPDEQEVQGEVVDRPSRSRQRHAYEAAFRPGKLCRRHTVYEFLSPEW